MLQGSSIYLSDTSPLAVTGEGKGEGRGREEEGKGMRGVCGSESDEGNGVEVRVKRGKSEGKGRE